MPKEQGGVSESSRVKKGKKKFSTSSEKVSAQKAGTVRSKPKDVPNPKSSDFDPLFEDSEMEVMMSHKSETHGASGKSSEKKELVSKNKKLDNDETSSKSVFPDINIEVSSDVFKEKDDSDDDDDDDDYVPVDEKREAESEENGEGSESELNLDTTGNDSAQEEMDVQEGEFSVDEENSIEEEEEEKEKEDDEEEGDADEEEGDSDEEEEDADEEEDDADEESSNADSENLTVDDLIDDEAEEGSETDESESKSEITLSSTDEEKKEALFGGGTSVGKSASSKKSNRQYDSEEDNDMDDFIVDDGVVEHMTSEEANDLPDVMEEENIGRKKRRILKMIDSSDSEDAEAVTKNSPRSTKITKSKKRSLGTQTYEKHEQVGEKKQKYETGISKSQRDSDLPQRSEQEASVSKASKDRRIVKGSRTSKGKKIIRSPKVQPRLSRLDEFRISKGLSPPRKRRESRDGSENWLISDKVSTDDPSKTKKKYVQVTTLYRKKDSNNACKRVMKRSRCESESPMPRKKFKC